LLAGPWDLTPAQRNFVNTIKEICQSFTLKGKHRKKPVPAPAVRGPQQCQETDHGDLRTALPKSIIGQTWKKYIWIQIHLANMV